MGWLQWLQNMPELQGAGAGTSIGTGYARIAAEVLNHAAAGRGETLVDVGTGMGLLAFAALSCVGESGRVIGVDADGDCIKRCRDHAKRGNLNNAAFVHGSALSLPLASRCAEIVVCRSVLCHIVDKETALREWFRILKEAGRFSFFEPIDRYDTRFCDLVDFHGLGEVANRLRQAETAVHHDRRSSLMNFDESELRDLLQTIGFRNVEHRLAERRRAHKMTYATARDWWHIDIGGIGLPGHPSPYETLRQYLSPQDLDACVDLFCATLDGRTIAFHSKQLYMWGSK